MAQLTTCVVLLSLAGLALAQFMVPPLGYNTSALETAAQTALVINQADHDRFEQEWEGYDGWYNNPAHPEWGGAGAYGCVCVDACRSVRESALYP